MTRRNTMPPDRVLLKCGHASNAVDENGNPICIICMGVKPGADVVAAAPNLKGRRARCEYYGQRLGYRGDCDYGGSRQPDRVCRCETESSLDLPFFTMLEGQSFDRFYCGCAFGWD